MANKMLIDATHPEETRVVVLRGNRVEEFDFESAQRKQLRGNIYLAKVTRVEPSLQAAFVDYGGNRHGFLAFSEIHPDYYQIPVADRQALIDEEGRAQRAAEDEDDRRSRRHRGRGRPIAARRDEEIVRSEPAETPAGEADAEPIWPTMMAGGFVDDDIETTFVDAEDEAAVEAEDTEGPTTIAESAVGARSRRGGRSEASAARPRQALAERTRARRRIRRAASGARRTDARADRRRRAKPEAEAPRPRTCSRASEPTCRRWNGEPENAAAGDGRTATTMKTAKKPPKKSLNRSAAPTRWKKSPIARRAIAANTRSRKSSSAGR